MPGMMDTVLNLGLNDADRRRASPQTSGDERFAWDSYRRFIQMYSDVVLELDHGAFEEALEIAKEDKGYLPRHRDDRRRLAGAGRRVQGDSSRSSGASPSRRTCTTSSGARSARCSDRGSRSAPRSIAGSTTFPPTGAPRSTSRRWCSAIWATPRPPASPSPAIRPTGDRAYYGEFLINAQGEDVVAGIRTPQYLTKAAREAAGAKPLSMEEAMPETYGRAGRVFDLLETHYRDMQDIEFTVQQGKLWMLQTRSGKRTAKAALKIAVDMAERRADHGGGGGRPRRSGGARPAAPPDARSRRAARRADQGPARVARRGLGQDRVRRRHRREARRSWATR